MASRVRAAAPEQDARDFVLHDDINVDKRDKLLN
jgi:hypothetical protein